MTTQARIAQVQAAADECCSRIVKARVTYILDDGKEFVYQEAHCRPGQAISFTVPAPGDVEVS